MSTTGYTLFGEIRAADDVLKTVSSHYWGSGNYYIAFIGTPSAESAWMLQIDGHHLAYNLTFNGKRASGTPMFAGVEPRTWTASGTTHAPLETQRAAIYNLAQVLGTLPAANLSGIFDDVLMGPNGTGNHDTNYPQNYPSGTSGRGVLAASLTTAQQALVKTAIEAWVNNMNSTIASDLLSAYESDSALAQTYVAYSGSTTLDTQGSYVRIDGPRVWIEFVCQPGMAYPEQHSLPLHLAGQDRRLRRHVQVIMRLDRFCAWLAAVVWVSSASAHPMPSSAVLLDFYDDGVAAELRLPLDRLEIAFAHPLMVAPAEVVARLRSRALGLHHPSCDPADL